MRVLITGAAGFAARHLARACAAAGDEVVGVSRTGEHLAGYASCLAADLCDGAAVSRAVAESQPDVVYHLAAFSSVGRSWSEPARTVNDNVLAAAHLLEAIRSHAPRARLIWVSSCEVYGPAPELPTTEEAPLQPASPYAVSKAAAEQLAVVYADAHGLDVVRVRPYSHAGPGQLPVFLLSSLAQQGAEARMGEAERVRIEIGNPDTRRDFTDVRDVVRAYRLLAERAAPGLYNVSSGRSISTGEQVQLLADLLAPLEVEMVVDRARVRAHEVMELRGSPAKLTAATGWRPEIPLRQTMADTLAWWEQELRAPAGMRH